MLIRKAENAARSPVCLNRDFQDFMISKIEPLIALIF